MSLLPRFQPTIDISSQLPDDLRFNRLLPLLPTYLVRPAPSCRTLSAVSRDSAPIPHRSGSSRAPLSQLQREPQARSEAKPGSSEHGPSELTGLPVASSAACERGESVVLEPSACERDSAAQLEVVVDGARREGGREGEANGVQVQ